MREAVYTKQDLLTMQAWPLERKIQVTQAKIIEWYRHYGGRVSCSFSGGKDSTVLLDLARRLSRIFRRFSWTLGLNTRRSGNL